MPNKRIRKKWAKREAQIRELAQMLEAVAIASRLCADAFDELARLMHLEDPAARTGMTLAG